MLVVAQNEFSIDALAGVQGEQALDRRTGGLGLGLAIVRTLVRMHGGNVSAESDGPGLGSRFCITLPLDRQEAARGPVSPGLGAVLPTPAPVPAHEHEPGHQGPPGPGPGPGPVLPAARLARVLIVDDNVDAALTLAEIVRMTGHEVMTAHDGPAALAGLAEFAPDIAVLDIGLPGMSGYELAHALRGAQGRSPLRLIALTGYGQPQDRERALAAGFDEHLVKPVSVQRLLDVMASLFRR